MSENTMLESASHWCVLLPCSKHEIWAVPQKCLAEIVTLPADSPEPPEVFNWRGRELAVLNLDESGDTPWRDKKEATGLVAVMLGLEGGSWDYCGVALRGEGLGMKDLARESIEDAPDCVAEGAVSAFRMGGKLYQVPELQELCERKERQLSAA